MLVYGSDEEVCEWVSYQLLGNGTYFKGDRAIGVMKDNQLIAGIIYHNYTEDPWGLGVSIEMSIASIDKRWCTRHNLRALFGYPFIDLKVKRVHTTCNASEGDIVGFNKRLGFIQEGFHPEAWPLGGDAISFGMLRKNCKWTKGE